MKHTIPPQQAMNYPCLQPAECELLHYTFGTMVEVTLYLGNQDGFWVSGYKLIIRGREKVLLRRELSASRKWGEYVTREQAIRDTLLKLNALLYVYRTQPIRNEFAFAESMKRLADTIKGIAGIQAEIFNS